MKGPSENLLMGVYICNTTITVIRDALGDMASSICSSRKLGDRISDWLYDRPALESRATDKLPAPQELRSHGRSGQGGPDKRYA